MMYCGMASSHHFTSASPRDSRCGYSTSRCAGYVGSSASVKGGYRSVPNAPIA